MYLVLNIIISGRNEYCGYRASYREDRIQRRVGVNLEATHTNARRRFTLHKSRPRRFRQFSPGNTANNLRGSTLAKGAFTFRERRGTIQLLFPMFALGLDNQ